MTRLDQSTRHALVDAAGIRTFYREAGPVDAPVLLLPHGYPCSSYEFRNLLPALGDRWRLIAPDAPGFGYSGTPAVAQFPYTFAAYSQWLEGFAEALGLSRYALYLHDYGSQFGLELALRHPERVTALVIQNGDIYADEHGPKYAALKEHWANPTPEGREKLAANVTEEGFHDEFVGEIHAELVERITPDLWTLHWALMNTPDRRENVVRLFEDQANTLDRFGAQQEYLRTHRPPTLILWGVEDGYMPEGAARAYLRDVPDAELHLFDGGHWLLETHFPEAAARVQDFLSRVLSS
ncbi:alpha/beta fold hydrolase [Agromyces albus]|uniref:alpha/beta fold hydrolase n=1 Tax=Agromyces albus TaxID=205332 RepID=UPI0027852DB1|nr:alpha/beta hydrolase [Agromyces albus]MDQ0574165.1 pimeloyl-ACP methyl ester carboxylesterase [Agromyces albus]